MLGRVFGAGGIAAGIALGAWSNALALIRRGAATFGFSIDEAARRRLPRMVAAAAAMGGLLWLAVGFLTAPGTDAHGLAHAVLLMALIAAGIAVYGLFLALSGAIKWNDAVNAIRQTGRADLRD